MIILWNMYILKEESNMKEQKDILSIKIHKVIRWLY